MTTRSIPALRAFLDGERELGENRWDEATLAYRSAIAADSSFGLAHFRYALARFWTERRVEPQVLESLRQHMDILPEREGLLANAFLTPSDSISLTVERYRVVTQRFPDYWPGWFLYGDVLAHFGPFLGHDWSEGLEAFRHVVALNPKLVPAWHEAMQAGWWWTPSDALSGPAYLARARLEEARGEARLAGEYYRLFLRRYDHPMPSQTHLVEEAMAALARLQQDR